ncbi:21175_t:CDS:2, partial [Entrophospora sp. SA101]
MKAITLEQRARIYTLIQEGYSSHEIAFREKISHSTVVRIKQRKEKTGRTSSKPLPNGYCAHQMPEMVEIWIDELKNASQSPSEIFIEELQTAHDLLNEQEFLNLADKVQFGIEKAFEAFKKWMIACTHLPFCICSLGGESGPEFAQAVNHI